MPAVQDAGAVEGQLPPEGSTVRPLQEREVCSRILWDSALQRADSVAGPFPNRGCKRPSAMFMPPRSSAFCALTVRPIPPSWAVGLKSAPAAGPALQDMEEYKADFVASSSRSCVSVALRRRRLMPRHRNFLPRSGPPPSHQITFRSWRSRAQGVPQASKELGSEGL